MNKIVAAIGALLFALSASAQYVGDYPVGTTNVCRFFRTAQPSTGASFALAGTPGVEIYKDGSDTEDTDDSGVTLSVSVDSVAGQNRICIDTSSDGTFYSAGSWFSVNLEAGTVDSVSVVGESIMSFSLEKTAALRPATNGREIAVGADGLPDVNVDEWDDTDVPAPSTAGVPSVDMIRLSGDSGAADLLEALLDSGATGNCANVGAWGIKAMGVAAAYTAGTPSVTLHTDCVDGMAKAGETVLVRGSGGATYWQSAIVVSSSGDVVTIDAAFATAPTTTFDFILFTTADNASGAADFTANERTAIKEVLGVGADDATPNDPTTGIGDTIRDGVVAVQGSGFNTSTDSLEKLQDEHDATQATLAGLNNLSTADVRGIVIEDQGGGVSLGCAIAIVLAYAAGDISTSGGNTTYEDPSGAETRVTGTVASAGNRTAAITCPTY